MTRSFPIFAAAFAWLAATGCSTSPSLTAPSARS
jgi:hypothetical protein